MSVMRIGDTNGDEVNVNGDGSLSVSLINSNAIKAVAVTPNDTNTLTNGLTKGIYIGGTGNVVVTMADGNDATFTNLQVGMIHPIACNKIKATNTTATSILAIY